MRLTVRVTHKILCYGAAKTYTAGQAGLQLIPSHRMTPEDMLLTLREVVGLQRELCQGAAFEVSGKHMNRHAKHTILMYF